MHTLINLTVPATLAGERLDLALVALLTQEAPQLAPSRRQVKKWLDEGKVQINHKTCRMASRALRAGERVAVAIPQAEPELNLTPALLRPQDIIFEDEDLLVINKPAGLPSQGTRDPTRPHVVQAAQRWLEQQRVPHPYIALHHRLDVETSGVLAMAKARRANVGLARAFRERRAQKAYVALVSSDASPWPHADEAAWEVRDHLGEVQGGARRGSVLSGGDPAHSSFRWIARGEAAALVLAKPHTGRTHQLRAHLSEQGMPILGDRRYDGAPRAGELRIARVMLHAWRLILDHPVTGHGLVLEAPLPEDLRALADALTPGWALPQ